MNRRIYQLIRDKRTWDDPRRSCKPDVRNTEASKGWYTRGYLPHYDQPGTIQMVTFRLADAIPASRRAEWGALWTIQDEREQRTRLEAYLDKGHGTCVLRRPQVAAKVERALLRFDGERYRMTGWVVMPNHVHLLVELWETPLGKLLKGWKGVSANAVNRVLGRTGNLWQVEYWDRYMRDEAHFRKALHYIEVNPVKACLVRKPEEWPWSSANVKRRWDKHDRYNGGRLLNKQSTYGA